MPRQASVQIGAPWLGKVASTAFCDQVPHTIVECQDVWPIDCRTDRARLSTRAGFETFEGETGVNMIAMLNVNSASDYGRELVISDGGVVEVYNGSAFVAAGGDNIDSDRPVYAASYQNVLYIASDTYKKYTGGGAVASWAGVDEGNGVVAVPSGCLYICEWGSRIVLSGNPSSPHTVYMSRLGDPTKWDTAMTDTGAAVTVANINEPITALIPHNRDCLICGTWSSMWIFRGDPGEGGVLEKFAHVVGPVGPKAWCKDANDYTYFLTRDGLYRMAPGCGVPPVPISRNLIPADLLGLDGVNDVVWMEYDTRYKMVHIYVQGDNSQYFHYFPGSSEEDPGSFWPVTSPGSGIQAIGRSDIIETANESGVLIAPASNLKRLSDNAAIGGATEAYVKFLFKMGEAGQKSQIQYVNMVFGADEDQDNAVIGLYGAETAEDATEEPAGRYYETDADTVIANHNNFYPKISGQYGMLEITQENTSNRFTLEQATLYSQPQGRER